MATSAAGAFSQEWKGLIENEKRNTVFEVCQSVPNFFSRLAFGFEDQKKCQFKTLRILRKACFCVFFGTT